MNSSLQFEPIARRNGGSQLVSVFPEQAAFHSLHFGADTQSRREYSGRLSARVCRGLDRYQTAHQYDQQDGKG
jgi:hypothetical protein